MIKNEKVGDWFALKSENRLFAIWQEGMNASGAVYRFVPATTANVRSFHSRKSFENSLAKYLKEQTGHDVNVLALLH